MPGAGTDSGSSRSPSRSASSMSRSGSSRSPSRSNASRSGSSRSPSRSYSGSRSPSRSYSGSRSPSRSYSGSYSGSYSRSGSRSYNSYDGSSVYSSEGSWDDTSAERDYYSQLPQPKLKPVIHPSGREPYLKSLQDNINALGEHVISIQQKQAQLLDTFSTELRKTAAKTASKKEDKELEGHRGRFLDTFDALQAQRRLFRELLYDATRERNNLIRAKEMRRKDEWVSKRKIHQIDPVRGIDWFLFLFFTIQVAIFVLYILFIDYPEVPDSLEPTYLIGAGAAVDYWHTFVSGALIFVVAGYSLLSASGKRYGWTSVSLNFLVAAFAIEWAIIMNTFFQWIDDDDFSRLELGFPHMARGIYGGAAAMISIGGIMGKMSSAGVLLFAFFQVIFWALNNYICLGALNALDPGGGITVHLFGGVFGFVAVAWTARHITKEDRIEVASQSSYQTDRMSWIGAAILFVFFPSFVGVTAPAGTQHRVVINTVLSMTTAAVVAFMVQWLRMLQPRGKIMMSRLVHTALAGGVAISSLHALVITPFAAMATGGATALLTCVFASELAGWWLFNTLGWHDTRQVLAHHVLPGLIAGLVGIFSSVEHDSGTRFGQPVDSGPDALYPEGGDQAQAQTAAVFITVGLAFLASTITTLGLQGVKVLKRPKPVFADDAEYKVGMDYED